MTRCTFDPAPLVGVPLGMFHCPSCGCMVLAGFEHGPCEQSCEQYDDDDRAAWDRACEQMARSSAEDPDGGETR